MAQDLLEQIKIPEYWLSWTYFQSHLLRSPLIGLNQERVNIIDHGRQNYDNGPDVLDATIEINGIRYQGDVEFHLAAQDWFLHGHHQDERYRRVILHLLWDSGKSLPADLGHRFSNVCLRHHLSLSEAAWIAEMQRLERQHQAENANFSLSEPLTSQLMIDLAERRFFRKMDRLQSWCRRYSFEDVLFIALAETFGYSKNKFPFRQLLWECPPSHIFAVLSPLIRSPLSIFMYLVMRGGLIPACFSNRLNERQSPSIHKMQDLYHQYNQQGVAPLLKMTDWNFSRVRPNNHPVIRLAALAQLIYQHQSPGLFQKLLATAMERKSLCETLSSWKLCLRAAIAPQLREALAYLYRFKHLPRHNVGTMRYKQFVINALLPLLNLWAHRTDNTGFQAYLEGIYEQFPGIEDRQIVHRQTRLTDDPVLAKKIQDYAIYQQGMLELFSEKQKQFDSLSNF